MLVSYHMQPHDLTLLLLPLSFIADALFQSLKKRRGGDRQAIRFYEMAILCGLLLLILPLAYMVLAWGTNYLVSLAVYAVMVSAAKINTASTDNASAAILGTA
jgi:hypothetical protein